MSSSPDMYHGLIKQANQLCDEAIEILTGKTKEGFIRLVHVREREDALCNLSECIGMFKHAIKGLKKGEKPIKNYKTLLDEMEALRTELKVH